MERWPFPVSRRPLRAFRARHRTDNGQRSTPNVFAFASHRPATSARPPYTKVTRVQTALALLGAASVLSACDPIFDIDGAFFPSWMLSLLVGVLLTVALRVVFLRAGVEPYLGPLPLIYTCLALLLTMSTWVLFFYV
jgi:hypothetical protein